MKIFDDINNILEQAKCSCYRFDEDNLQIIHEMSMYDARYSECNHKVFIELTGLLLTNNINYEVTSENNILIKA